MQAAEARALGALAGSAIAGTAARTAELHAAILARTPARRTSVGAVHDAIARTGLRRRPRHLGRRGDRRGGRRGGGVPPRCAGVRRLARGCDRPRRPCAGCTATASSASTRRSRRRWPCARPAGPCPRSPRRSPPPSPARRPGWRCSCTGCARRRPPGACSRPPTARRPTASGWSAISATRRCTSATTPASRWTRTRGGSRRCLDPLVAAWPVTVEELVLVGHSLGGLVAVQACHEADARRRRVGPGAAPRGLPRQPAPRRAARQGRAPRRPGARPRAGDAAVRARAGAAQRRRARPPHGRCRGGPVRRRRRLLRDLGHGDPRCGDQPLGRVVGDLLVRPASAAGRGGAPRSRSPTTRAGARTSTWSTTWRSTACWSATGSRPPAEGLRGRRARLHEALRVGCGAGEHGGRR